MLKSILESLTALKVLKKKFLIKSIFVENSHSHLKMLFVIPVGFKSFEKLFQMNQLKKFQCEKKNVQRIKGAKQCVNTSSILITQAIRRK